MRRTLAEILDENLLNVKIRTELGLFELNAGLSAVAVVLDEVKVIALAVAKCKLCENLGNEYPDLRSERLIACYLFDSLHHCEIIVLICDLLHA